MSRCDDETKLILTVVLAAVGCTYRSACNRHDRPATVFSSPRGADLVRQACTQTSHEIHMMACDLSWRRVYLEYSCDAAPAPPSRPATSPGHSRFTQADNISEAPDPSHPTGHSLLRTQLLAWLARPKMAAHCSLPDTPHHGPPLQAPHTYTLRKFREPAPCMNPHRSYAS